VWAAAALLVVQEAAEVRKGVPRGNQRRADAGRFHAEVPAAAGVRGQKRRQPDFYAGYDATLTQVTRAKLAGSRDQLSPSSELAKTSPPVVPT